MPISSDINFSPNASPVEPSVKDQIFQWVIKNGKRLVIFTQAVVLLVFISRFKFDTDLRNITTEIDQNQAIVESLADVEAQYTKNQENLGIIKPIIEGQVDWETRLRDFNKKIPNDLTLENVAFTNNTALVTAKANNIQSFQAFINLLIIDPSIRSAVLQSSQYSTEDGTYGFIINIEI